MFSSSQRQYSWQRAKSMSLRLLLALVTIPTSLGVLLLVAALAVLLPCISTIKFLDACVNERS